MSEILRQGFTQTEAVTGRTREQQLHDLYNRLVVKNQELNQDAQSVVDGEGRNIIINTHSFSVGSLGAVTTTVTIGETLKTTGYGVVITRNLSGATTAFKIDNKTTETFDVSFTVLAVGSYTFSWMVVY